MFSDEILIKRTDSGFKVFVEEADIYIYDKDILFLDNPSEEIIKLIAVLEYKRKDAKCAVGIPDHNSRGNKNVYGFKPLYKQDWFKESLRYLLMQDVSVHKYIEVFGDMKYEDIVKVVKDVDIDVLNMYL